MRPEAQLQGVGQKIKTADVFLKLGSSTSVYEKWPTYLATTKNTILGKKISEYDIVQHTKISTEKCFFFAYNKLGIWNRNKETD